MLQSEVKELMKKHMFNLSHVADWLIINGIEFQYKSGTIYLIKKSEIKIFSLVYIGATGLTFYNDLELIEPTEAYCRMWNIKTLDPDGCKKPLKLFNGRGHGKFAQSRFNIAAYSMTEASQLASKASGINVSVKEIREYYSPMWGRDMENITATKPCLYVVSGTKKVTQII